MKKIQQRGIIYLTTNNITGDTYIGQTVKSYDWITYYGDKIYYGSGAKIIKQLRKYGYKNFTRETVELVEGKEKLNNRETFWVQFFKPTLNLMTKCTGIGAHSEETKRKLEEIRKKNENMEYTEKDREKLRDALFKSMEHPKK